MSPGQGTVTSDSFLIAIQCSTLGGEWDIPQMRSLYFFEVLRESSKQAGLSVCWHSGSPEEFGGRPREKSLTSSTVCVSM